MQRKFKIKLSGSIKNFANENENSKIEIIEIVPRKYQFLILVRK